MKNVLCGFAMGILLAICGIPFTKWEFYALFFGFKIISFIERIED